MDKYVDQDGVVRKLGWRPPSSEEHLKMRAGTTSILSYMTKAGRSTLFAESEYETRDFVSPFRNIISDQASSSGCSGWSAAQAFRRQRLLRGMPDHDFSGAFVYAHANHRRDDGSNMLECLSALERVGVCLRSEFDFPNIYDYQIPAAAMETAKRFKLVTRVTVDSAEECASALMLGLIPCIPVCVDNDFGRYDSDGVIKSKGSTPNHAVHLAGMVKVNGRWCFIMPNTWSRNWGPFVKSKPEWAGCALIEFAAINRCDKYNDGYAQVDSLWETVS